MRKCPIPDEQPTSTIEGTSTIEILEQLPQTAKEDTESAEIVETIENSIETEEIQPNIEADQIGPVEPLAS